MKRTIRGLGLSLLATFGLMAFMAAGAQAGWDIAGSQITGEKLVGGALKETAKLLVPAVGVNLEIRCTSVDVEVDSRIRPLPNNDALAFLLYLGCTSYKHSTGELLPKCIPDVLLVKAKIRPFLHNNVVKLLAEPETGAGGVFTEVHFDEEVCSLPPTSKVLGSVVFECEDNVLALRTCAFAAIKQLIRPVTHATQLSLYPTDVLKYGLNVALLKGEAEVFLTGAEAGKTFAALI